jgi:hypothetical protein
LQAGLLQLLAFLILSYYRDLPCQQLAGAGRSIRSQVEGGHSRKMGKSTPESRRQLFHWSQAKAFLQILIYGKSFDIERRKTQPIPAYI